MEYQINKKRSNLSQLQHFKLVIFCFKLHQKEEAIPYPYLTKHVHYLR
jgi:hypothetical protein